MKKDAYLSMLELAVMLTVFALICAGALELFSRSHEQSLLEQETSLAALACASRIEEIKYEKKLPSEAVFLNERFERVPDAGTYEALAEALPSGSPYLEKALVSIVRCSDGSSLYRAECAWQVASHE